MLSIRLANKSDLPVIVGIYNQAIRSKQATAHLKEFTVDQRENWFNQFNENLYPIYVAVKSEQVVGYVSLSPYRKEREALDKVAEISFYIDANHTGQGIGSTLVKQIIADCKRLKKETLLAILLDVNTASIKLLKKFGFEEWGNLPLHSNFDGVSYGHLYYGLNINE